MMSHCSHCGKETQFTTRSLFTTGHLCRACSEKERTSPIYQRAHGVAVDEEPPNHNLPGIAGPGKDGINFYR